jgi:transcriptional regulator with XRE-family HTH domain
LTVIVYWYILRTNKRSPSAAMSAVPQPTSPVDTATRAARGRLAQMLTRLLDHWQLSAAEQAELLGLSTASRSTLARYRSGEPLADSRDLLDRAGHLLGIHKSLRLLFPHDRDLAYRWMTQPNRRLGARPLDLVIVHGFEGLLALRRYLDFQRGQ